MSIRVIMSCFIFIVSNLSKCECDQFNKHVKIFEHGYDSFNEWVNKTKLRQD